MGQPQTGPVQRVGGFRYLVNRGRRNWSDAVNFLAAKHPEYSDDVVFSYFDLFGGKTLPDVSSCKRQVGLIDRSVTDVYDHKRGLAERVRAAGCEDAFAASYFSAEEALKATV